MRWAISLIAMLCAGSALAGELIPLAPLPAGVPDRDTPGKPVAGGMRYDYPQVIDMFGRFGPLDWCFAFGSACGKPAAEAFCKQVDGGARPHSSDFGHWAGAGHYTHTVIISTRDSFELPRAEAFTYIVCKK